MTPTMGEKLGIVRLSRELVCKALFPEGTKLIDISAQLYFDSGDIAFKVSHPELRQLQEAEKIPIVQPQYRYEFDERGEKEIFERWKE